ncbi:MAG: chorismate mutase [Sphingomonadaceae bacterium]|nr:chorismate mutase [Sphingomonadaceae bacterium]
MLSRVTPKSPEECMEMPDVRAGVDAIDTAIMDLLAQRFAYMEAAARIKSDRDAVRDERRKKEVIDNALSRASELGVPASLVAELWDRLVEASIAYEFDRWDELNANG